MDRYAAPLTGDIWMKVSHRYAGSEVDSLVDPGTSDAVRTAVRQIFDGLAAPTLTVTEAAGEAVRKLQVRFIDSENPRDNISAYSLLGDGLTRVHPGGYAALFTAALASGVESIRVTSCWRPMLGSIAHRAGLGLDVDTVGATKINRQELRAAFEGRHPSRKGDGDDGDNVSDAEVQRFGEYEAAIAQSDRKAVERKAAVRALQEAEKSRDAASIASARQRLSVANDALEDAVGARNDAFTAWNRERDAGQPQEIRRFRALLLQCTCVRQLFDPWYMDADTHDNRNPEPNMQRGNSKSNERLHAHHLHITVRDPHII